MSSSPPRRATPIAIVGMDCLFPDADGLGAYWHNIRDGIDAIREVPATHWSPDEYFDKDPKRPDFTYAQRGGFIPSIDFDPLAHGLPPTALEATDTSQLLGLYVAQRALADAGYGPGVEFDRSRVSVLLGVTGCLELVIPLGARLGHPVWRRALRESGVPEEKIEEIVGRIADGFVPWQENSFPGLLGNVVAGRIANRLDLGGSNCVVDAACASSLSALHLAALELEQGRADVVVSGGIDTFNDIFMYMCFSKTPALSASGNARPFDRDGDGTILGEGLGVMVLKRLEDAERDGDRIYAVIRGIASSSDGKGQAIYAPSSKGQAVALKRAYELADVTPDSIELVEAHGTGTVVGDATEVRALTQVYREARNDGTWCALGSVKSQIGHTKAAAGVAGLMKAALALHHRTLPPTLKVDHPLDEVAPGETPFYVNTKKRPWLPRAEHPRRAAISAFGFGGSNFHCVLEEAPVGEHATNRNDWDGASQLALFSADSKEALDLRLAGLAIDEIASWSAVRTWAAETRRSFVSSAAIRLAIVVQPPAFDDDGAELTRTLTDRIARARAVLADSEGHDFFRSPDRISVARGRAGKLAVLFPGQGSQYTGMLRDLSCQFPAVAEAIDAGNAAFWDSEEARNRGERLSDYIYPPPAFAEDVAGAQQSALRATDVAQPAIGAVSLGAWRVLEQFGVRGDAFAGHSFGELTALCAAERITPTAFATLANFRGQLMAQGGGDRGSMLAVSAPLDAVAEVLREEGLDLVIANRNAPKQMVLSGASETIVKAESAFIAREIPCKSLPVAAAFHSPFVSDARGPFGEALRRVHFDRAGAPVYANSSARPYPGDEESSRQLLAGQIAEPVRFVELVENLYADGVRTFLEVGPSATLRGLVDATLEGRAHTSIAIDGSRGHKNGVADFADALGQLAVLGHALDTTAWDAEWVPPTASGKKRMTVRINGANIRYPALPKKSTAPAPAWSADEAKPAAIAAPSPSNRETNVPTPKPAAAPPAPSAPRVIESRPIVNEPQPSADRPAASVPSGLAWTQEQIEALQAQQAKAAELHAMFLEGQRAAQETLRALLEAQNQWLAHGGASGDPEAAFLGKVEAPVVPAYSAPTAASAPAVTTPIDPSPATSNAPTIRPPITVSEPTEPAPAIATPTTPAPAEVPPAASAPVESAPVESAPVESAPVESANEENIAVENIATLLEVVAEKTGYPVEMLELSMELDADLGIDSIKRVEILSAFQERVPGATPIGPEELGSIRTLADVAAKLETSAPASAAAPPAPALTPAPVNESTAPAPAAAPSSEHIDMLLEVVAEKTGYPVDMLELSMELDADLGIDSIKRVEILSAFQERVPGATAIGPEELGSIRTLEDVAAKLQPSGAAAPAPAPTASVEPTTPAAPSTTPAPPAPEAPAASGDADAWSALLLTVVAEKTGYPEDMLELTMELDADLGIDSIKRVEILSTFQEREPNAPKVGPEQLGQIRTLADVVALLTADASPAAPATTSAKVETSVVNNPAPTAPVANTPVTNAPVSPGSSGQIDRYRVNVRPIDANAERESIDPVGGSTIWITTDGSGLSEALAERLRTRGFKPRLVSAASARHIKAPESLSGLILLAPLHGTDDTFLRDSVQLARLVAPGLMNEALEGDAFLVSVSRLDGAFGFGERDSTIADPRSGGLAGLVKSATHEWGGVHTRALDLAPTLRDPAAAAERILNELFHREPREVGLSADANVALTIEASATPTAEEPPLARGDVVVVTGGARGVTAAAAAALGRAWQPHLVLLGRSPLPPAEPEWLVPLDDEVDIKRAILEKGGRPLTPREVESEYQRIRSAREIRVQLEELDSDGTSYEYHAVDLRDANAVENVLRDVRGARGPIRGIVHGAGVLADQRILDKDDASFDRVYRTKVTGFENLWAALDPSELRAVAFFSSSTARFGRSGQCDYAMANEVLNKRAQQIAREYPNVCVRSMGWGPWDGGMVTPALKNLFSQEGVEVIPIDAGAEQLVGELSHRAPTTEVVILGAGSRHPGDEEKRTEQVIPLSDDPCVFERTVDVAGWPFLKSHVMDGRAVLPMAMIIEWLAHGALTDNPGLHFHGFDQLRVLKGVTLEPTGQKSLRVHAGRSSREGELFAVPVELRGVDSEGRERLHARARVLLAEELPSDRPRLLATDEPYKHAVEDVYRELLFHGPELQGIEEVEGCSPDGVTARCRTAPRPRQWIESPLRGNWLADPLAIDVAFQLMILWSLQNMNAGSLPCFAGSYRQFRSTFPTEGVRVVVVVKGQSEHNAYADIEFVDSDGLVARLENYECVVDRSLEGAFRANRLPIER